MKFQQQQRRLRQRQFRIGIAGPHLLGVEQLDARDGNAGLDRQNRGLAGAAHALERTGRRRDGLGNAAQLDREFADDAERAFGADEQMREVVTGRGFLRPRARGDDLAVAAHHFERQHVVAHGAVAHRIGAGGAGRGHAAERGIGAGVDREEHALVAQMLVERLAGDAGLDHAVQIVGMDCQHLVHVAQIDADAAGRRVDLPLQRGAGAERDHRDAMLGANPHHVLNIGGFLRHHHRVRRLRGQPGRGMGVLVAHRLRGDQPVAEPRGQRVDGAFQRLRLRPLRMVGYRCRHAKFLPALEDRGKGYIRGQETRSNRQGCIDDDRFRRQGSLRFRQRRFCPR